MTFHKRLLALTFLAGALGALGACGRDDPVVSPPSRWDLGTVPSFASVPAACAAAVDAEVANIAMYDRLVALDPPADLRTVFTNNRAATVNNHTPAFMRCR